MSEIQVNKIIPVSGTDVTLGDSSDTFTVPSGVTLAVASGATVTNSGTASGFGGGALTFLATVTASASSEVSFDGFFSSDYTNYVVYYSNILPAGASVMDFRVRVSDTNQTSLYTGAFYGTRLSTGSAVVDQTNGSYSQAMQVMTWGENQGTTATHTASGHLILFDPLNAVAYKNCTWQTTRWSSTPYFWAEAGSSSWLSATALSGISFGFNSHATNITSGTFTLYGIKNS